MRRGLLLAAAALGVVSTARAQHAGHEEQPRPWWLGAQAILVGTRVDPGPRGKIRTEGYLTQPMLMAGADSWAGRLYFRAMLDLEGLTLARGELNTGTYGEGYIDRRHPHTYVHELVVGARADVGRASGSLTFGRGFVPFGTDDPMSRPFVKYPVNHHIAQALERLIIVGALRYRAVALEGGLFNGDEPISAGGAPSWSRLGDSWAIRVTANPFRSLELSGSHARVASPEVPGGFGLDQRKWSVSARYASDSSARLMKRVRYAFIEWGRTTDYLGELETFRFPTTLAEAVLDLSPVDASVRLERTSRPEELRLLDEFRTPRPLDDLHIIGITRWTTVTLALARELNAAAARVAPFIEATALRPRAVLSPTAFVPEEFYGRRLLWSLSIGVRVGVGHRHDRVGRYGAALRK